MNMLKRIFSRQQLWVMGFVWLMIVAKAEAAVDFIVTSPSTFAINGTNSLTLNLVRGRTYVFTINTDSFHPFIIKTNATAGTSTAYNTGLSANNINSGTITWTVATNAPNLLRYVCSVHGASLTGNINIANPPTPPTVRILSTSLTASNVTIKSTGTNGFSVTPLYASNLVGTINWTAVPSFTNTYANGTNTTIFNRLEPICGPNVYLRIRNQ